jgi:FMN phosphatase YigB (HAD superfamily)
MERSLAVTGLGALFDFVVLSSEEHLCRKPCSKIFWEALGKSSVDLLPEECLYVGNKFSRDVIGPARVGMRTAFVVRNRDKYLRKVLEWRANPAIRFRPDFLLRQIADLLVVLPLD